MDKQYREYHKYLKIVSNIKEFSTLEIFKFIHQLLNIQ